MASSGSNIASQNEIFFCESEMLCSITNKVVKAPEQGAFIRQQIQLFEGEITCRHKTKITMSGESRYVIFFYFNQYQKQ